MRTWLARVVAGLAMLALVWAALIRLAGGFTLTLAGARISSNNPSRPLLIALALGIAAIGLAGVERLAARAKTIGRRAIDHGARAIAALDRGLRIFQPIAAILTPARLAVALSLGIVVVGLRWSSWTGSGPDSFAYLSEAALFREGRLSAPAPLAAKAPWPDPTPTFAPFGYRSALDGTPRLVPVVAPGVPLLMALLQTIGGHAAAFLVTPIAAGGLVWLTFAIGRRVRSPGTGLAAAWFVATSPAIIFMLMWPMTDIPAAFWTALMIRGLIERSPATALGAGLAASAGVLTRTNSILIAAGAGAWLLIDAYVWRRGPTRWHRVPAFVVGLVPGLALMAWFNAQWFGSPLASGYGSAGELLSVASVGTNATNYLRWIAQSSPAALAGLAVLAVPILPLFAAGGRRAALLLAVVVATTCSVYLVYRPFLDWWYLRFLLPAWPALFVATGALFDAVGARGRVLAVTMVALAGAVGFAGARQAYDRGIFNLGWGERRYVTVARLADTYTDPNAVVLTAAHSGTVRYYAGRETLRFDLLDPAWLDRALAWLQSQGRHPYLLLEDWEEPLFRERFGAANLHGNIAFPPIATWQSPRVAGWVSIYDPWRHDAATARLGAAFEAAQPIAAPSAASPWP